METDGWEVWWDYEFPKEGREGGVRRFGFDYHAAKRFCDEKQAEGAGAYLVFSESGTYTATAGPVGRPRKTED